MFDALPTGPDGGSFVDSLFDDDALQQQRDSVQEVSPRRAKLRAAAFRAMQKQGAEMQAAVAKRDKAIELSVGAVVQVSLADVDRTRVDPRNLTCVVVECVRKGEIEQELKYRLATTNAVIKGLFTRPYLRPLVATPALMGLSSALSGWKSMPERSQRTCANNLSMVGGQGMLRCDCKGDCLHGKCKCSRAGRMCNSRCHKGNSKCRNHDQCSGHE